MKPSEKSSPSRSWFYWILPIILAVTVSVLARYTLIEKIELRLLDARFKLRGERTSIGSPFQVVAVDDQTFTALNTKWPFPGSMYAHMIENLNRAGARLIVFDIQFSEANQHQPGEDSVFAAAIKAAGNVILAGKIAYSYNQRLERPFETLVPPTKTLEETGVHWGIINEITDVDDFTRRYLLYLPHGGSLRTSLGLEVLRSLCQLADSSAPQVQGNTCRFGDLQIPLYDSQSMLINYYGPAGTFPAISFASVLDDSSYGLSIGQDSDYMERFFGGVTDSVFSDIKNPFLGKVILVGVSVEEMHDNKNSPFYDDARTPRKTPGIEVHAHALQTILDGSYIKRTSFFSILLVNILLAFLIFSWFGRYRPIPGLIDSLIVTGFVLLFAILLFNRNNLWIDLASPLSTIGISYISSLGYQYLREYREKIRIRDMFSHYVPDKLVSQLIDHPELLKLGGERRRLTILFADLVGFTSISEIMSPEELVELLNEYMTEMTEIILTCDGIIDKYEGDLIMAEFGAPIPFENHAARACEAALKMQQKISGMQNIWLQAGKPLLNVRIGIHTGDVIVGNMGSRDVFDYTVVGDAVNLSSRLEGANKILGTQILISQATHDGLPPNFISRELGMVRVRGRREGVCIFELLAARSDDLQPDDFKLIEMFQQGRNFYRQKQWQSAIDCFEALHQIKPLDRATAIYLRECRGFLINPPGTEWDGIISLEDE
ncbi:MAG: adenylate/guanylate cyclase domain-containing protein [bacterium]|nr:adenylate/guanylate cyclase domain-containing protein [bacterium]